MAVNADEPAFAVLPYSPDALVSQLDNEHVSAETIGKKRQVGYLKDYLQTIGARTLLVEFEYIDRDFLEDFAAYYVRCFANYDRRCKRLHFFSIDFSEDQFRETLSTGEGALGIEALQQNYLGFIAVKPLPDTIIGRTCLKTYPPEGTRHYTIVRNYKANLFGIPLAVKETLAFQEQDRVVAACASSALWSAFHGTSEEFGHRLPSPAEITGAAGAKASDVDRNLPSKGLTWSMMADAIRYVGLEPLYQPPADDNDLKATIYAYVRGGIPAVLGFNILDPADDPEEWRKKLHAVTVCGYRVPESGPVEDKYGFRLYAYRVDRLFVHDDQIGPFARMFIDGEKSQVTEDGEVVEKTSLGTLYPNQAGKLGDIRGVDPVVLLPLYHKIRIPYSLIHDTVFHFSVVFSSLLGGTDWAEIEWDIFLTTGNDFKTELSASKSVDGSRKLRYLTRPLPRFLWRARALAGGAPVLDLLFDATDIEQGGLFSVVIEYDQDLAKLMPQLFGDEGSKALFDGTTAQRIVDWYISAAKAVVPA
jgi:hypothetical protein